jgi:hypothetical protein
MNSNARRGILSAVLLLACSNKSINGVDSAPRRLSLDRASYAPGEAITASFTNETGTALVGFGSLDCGLELEGRHADGTWVVVTPASPICTLQLSYIAPGQGRLVVYRPEASVGPGTYRLATRAPEPVGSDVYELMYSPPFDIRLGN